MSMLKDLCQYAKDRGLDVREYPLPQNEICAFDFKTNTGLYIGFKDAWDMTETLEMFLKLDGDMRIELTLKKYCTERCALDAINLFSSPEASE
jgi:hypothetical protein